MGNELYAFIFLLVLASHGNSAPEQAKKLNHAELPVATASKSGPNERARKDIAKRIREKTR